MRKNRIFRRLSTSYFLLFILSFMYTAQTFSADKEGDHKYSAEEMIRGERLFYGLVYFGEKSVNCASCHNTQMIDTLNWNPDAWEISKKYLEKSNEDLKNVLLNPSGQMMAEVHKDFDLSDEDITLLKLYMDELAHEGLIQPKPVVKNLLLFIFAFILIVFALADLIFLRKIRFKLVHVIIIMASLFFIIQTLVVEAIDIGRSPGYAPDQPIKFSHEIHSGQNQIDCKYCHSTAEYSKSAGIPSLNVCMNCHLIVRNGSHSGAFEISKVIKSYEDGDDIEWIRIHNLPDHAFFSHAQHVGVGNIECQKCHGKVEEMNRVELVTDLSMGWCVNCHRETKIDLHSNEFYNNYEELAKKMQSGELEHVSVESIGGIECMKCHY